MTNEEKVLLWVGVALVALGAYNAGRGRGAWEGATAGYQLALAAQTPPAQLPAGGQPETDRARYFYTPGGSEFYGSGRYGS